MQIFFSTTKYSKNKEECLYIVGIESLEKLFEQMEQIPLTISYGHVILKTRCETDRAGNQLKQIEKNEKKLLTKKRPHGIVNELPMNRQQQRKSTLKTED